MDDDQLAEHLNASAPNVAPRTAALRAAINSVVVESRPPRRRRRRLMVTGTALSIVLLGGATTALASPEVLDWLWFTPDRTIQHANDAGELCYAGMIVRPEGVTKDDPSFVAGREIFLALDFDTLTIPDDIRDSPMFSAAHAAERAADIAAWNTAHPTATIEPAKPDPQSGMLYAAAYRLITDGLTARGLDPNAISLELAGKCDEAAG